MPMTSTCLSLDNVPLPNPSTVQEFKTQTSLYDASQGRNGGGNIQVALKSGGNEFHGDAYFFLRNNVLNANDFFQNAAGVARPVNRQAQYGFSIGGQSTCRVSAKVVPASS